MQKLIITIAPTGNVPTKELNPNSPLEVDEIVSDIKKAQNLGASIAHIHVRDENHKPTSDKRIFKSVVDEIEKQKIDIITQLSTGARGGGNSFDWRGQMLDLNIHMASLATGSSNFPTSVNANSPDLIESLALKMRDKGIKPEIEAFDVAMIENAVRLKKKGVIVGNLHFNLVMNVPGSIRGNARNLMFMIESLPKDSTFTVSGIGKSQVDMVSMAIMLGGHVRTGLEDVLLMRDKSYASNEGLVKQVLEIARIHGRKIADVKEAKEILQIL